MPQMSAINWLVMLTLFCSVLFVINVKLSHLQLAKWKTFPNSVAAMPHKLTNLFSSFDPCSPNLFFNNWVSMLMALILAPSVTWLMTSRYLYLLKTFLTKLNSDLTPLLHPTASSGGLLLFSGLLIFIMTTNFLGLFPYIFTSSSHLTMALSMALPLWLSFMLYGWINHMIAMFSHLVPLSTPPILLLFMVIIETISIIIRPGILAVRLSANMIAGHLLLTLMGGLTTQTENILLIVCLLLQVTLLTLECAVAIIQSCVFTVLSTIYSSEVVNH